MSHAMGFRRRVFRAVYCFLIVSLFCASSVPALAISVTSAGSVSGHVVDATGAPIMGVTVTVKSQVNGATHTASTDASGSYRIENVIPGSAVITFSAPGFSLVSVSNATITGGQTLTQNSTLPVAAGNEPVSVSVVIGSKEGNPTQETSDQKYVRVTLNSVAGPMGYAATPSLSSATQPANAQAQALAAAQQFNFPSIIFYISTSPLVYIPAESIESKDVDKIKSAQETNRNPEWLDVTFLLTPKDAKGATVSCDGGNIQVLGILPQQTVAGTKNQVVADVASGVNDVAGALASFYPGVKDQVSASTKAMNIIFQDIFPPKPVAYQYSNMNGNCEVGWFFRPDPKVTDSTGQASILGIQTGIVLLKTSKEIKTIEVSGQTLSKWDKAPTTYSKNMFATPNQTIGVIKLPDADGLDYDNLTSLTMFPVLIPKAQAMRIVHITQDADFLDFAGKHQIVGTNSAFDYVTNASLTAFVTGGGTKDGSQQSQLGSGGAGASNAPATHSTSTAAPGNAAGGGKGASTVTGAAATHK